ncbi:MAG: hypothetical protein U0Q16_01450 [Bryobacteraceae bacterium]
MGRTLLFPHVHDASLRFSGSFDGDRDLVLTGQASEGFSRDALGIVKAPGSVSFGLVLDVNEG